MIERFAVDQNVRRGGLGAGIADRLAANFYAIGVEPVARLAAGAVAKVGEELIDTSWRHGYIGRGDGRRRKNGISST